MSIKQRLNSIEKKLGNAEQGYASCTLPYLDTTRTPAVYIDQETGDIVPDAEVEKIKEEFVKNNPRKDRVFVQIGITNTKITDSSE